MAGLPECRIERSPDFRVSRRSYGGNSRGGHFNYLRRCLRRILRLLKRADSHVGATESRRDSSTILSSGFNIDRNDKRRKPSWTSIGTLDAMLPGFARWGLYRAFTTPTSIGLRVLAAALYLLTMFGVTLGNHRYWTHRGSRPGFRCRSCRPWRAACQ